MCEVCEKVNFMLEGLELLIDEKEVNKIQDLMEIPEPARGLVPCRTAILCNMVAMWTLKHGLNPLSVFELITNYYNHKAIYDALHLKHEDDPRKGYEE
jgi:hypothetical protein